MGSIFRPVRVGFWEDFKVLECMSPEDKLVFLYLLTGPSTKQVGIYPITLKKMAFDIGYSMESINCIVSRLESTHKVVTYNRDTREMAIKNWGRHGFIRLGKPVVDCVTKELREVKDTSLIEYVLERIESEPLKVLYQQEVDNRKKDSDDTFYDTSMIREQKEEKEEEKEKYKYKEKGESNNGNGEVSRKSKDSKSYERKNEQVSKRPSEELLQLARSL